LCQLFKKEKAAPSLINLRTAASLIQSWKKRWVWVLELWDSKNRNKTTDLAVRILNLWNCV